MCLGVVQIQIIIPHSIAPFLIVLCLGSSSFDFVLFGFLKGIISIEVFDTIVISIRVAYLVLYLVNLLYGRLLAHLRRLKLLTGLDHGRGQLCRFFHLFLELFEVFLALLLSFLFSLPCTINVNSELVTQVVCKLKFLAFHIGMDLLGIIFHFLLLCHLLQVTEEELALTELNVLVERLS